MPALTLLIALTAACLLLGVGITWPMLAWRRERRERGDR